MTRRFRGVKTMNLASFSAAAWKWTFERFTTAAVVVSMKEKVVRRELAADLFYSGGIFFFFATQRLDAANCAVGSPGLVGWWPGDGNARDIAGTNNGNLQGGASATTPGLIGSAFSFDGTNAYVQVPDSAASHPTNLTIECWVRFASLDSAGSGGSPAGDQYIVFKQNSLGGNFEGFDLSKTRTGNDFFRFMVSFSKGTVQVISQPPYLQGRGIMWRRSADPTSFRFTSMANWKVKPASASRRTMARCRFTSARPAKVIGTTNSRATWTESHFIIRALNSAISWPSTPPGPPANAESLHQSRLDLGMQAPSGEAP